MYMEIARYLFALLFVLQCEYIFAGKLVYTQKRMNLLKFELSEEIYRLLDFILLPIINYVEEEEVCNSHVSNFKRICNKNTETSYRRNCHEGDGKYKFHI